MKGIRNNDAVKIKQAGSLMNLNNDEMCSMSHNNVYVVYSCVDMLLFLCYNSRLNIQ
jgi:hypothetical protein